MPTPITVLVVDDYPDTCTTLADLLEMYDCQVVPCSDPLRALELSRTRTFDLVLLDIKMPGMHGLDLLRQIKPRGHGCIIMVTGVVDPSIKDAALQAGADDVMDKPLEIEKLLEVAEVVRRTGDCAAAPRSYMPGAG
jgi:DNA-binding response OmpR family regulator